MLLNMLCLFILLVSSTFALEVTFLRWKNKQPLSEMAARHFRFWSSLTVTAVTVIGTGAVVLATYTYRLALSLYGWYQNRK